jgi:hypothetical protein
MAQADDEQQFRDAMAQQIKGIEMLCVYGKVLRQSQQMCCGGILGKMRALIPCCLHANLSRTTEKTHECRPQPWCSRPLHSRKTNSAQLLRPRPCLKRLWPQLKADKAKALATFIKGEGGFKDRDLYPFCFSIADGKLNAASPITIGKDVRTLKDKTGDPYERAR